MHPHFAFSTAEILWTLTFASQLVLLVVLLGRDRAQRFPWFTASIVAVALRLLAGRLLADRLSRLTLAGIMITLALVSVVIGIMVLVEIARKAFVGAKRPSWVAGALGLATVGAVVLWFWGTWPAWKTLTTGPYIALRIMELAGRKGELLVGVLTIGVGLLVGLFGRRYGAGWRSHTQRIMIGLSTAALAQLSVQAILEIMSHHIAPKSRAEYDHILGLADRINNSSNAVYIAVLIWWVACLWMDEPGTASGADLPLAQPILTEPPSDEPLEVADPAPAKRPADEPVEAARPAGDALPDGEFS